ncbi:desulfoferrodoxin [Candidatus Fermentibacterales bacterium]|nr:desulfoferrodoxin [Candidatus Fermentibacterales bacterium]
MAERAQVYKCEVCGNIVEVLHGGFGTLVCCGQPMKLLPEQTADSSLEKHVPVIERTDEGILVRVGSVPHPMEEKHYIEWIQLIAGGESLRKYLQPGDKPEAFFRVQADQVSAREYCNVHGLWKGQVQP